MSDAMPGVATVPPPASIRDQIERRVLHEAANILQPNQHGAIVAVADTQGVNLAVVSKIRGGFELQMWMAKRWSGDAAVSVTAVKTW